MTPEFFETGWARWGADAALRAWLEHATPSAQACVHDPAQRALWLQCEGTWFVGVDALDNDTAGAVGASGPLAGAAYEAACATYGVLELHRAQVSVVYPDYPKPREGEGAGAYAYRRNRDAAHVDGLLPVGERRARKLMERHAYVLGLPMTACNAGASPMVVWEGSHRIMREVFEKALAPLAEADWAAQDLTEVYQAARRTVFETCKRVEVVAQPGEAYLLHRFALHGVAPWQDGAIAPEEGRMIAYFRPEFPAHTRDWLEAP